MPRGLPDFTTGVGILAQIIDRLAVDIVAQSLGNLKTDIAAQTLDKLAVDIAAQSLEKLAIDIVAQSLPTLKTDIAAQSIGNIKTDIAAQSVGNIAVDVAAQTLPALKTDIVAQTVGNIKTDIAAHSVGNIAVDIAAQTLPTLKTDIVAQTIGNIKTDIAAQSVGNLAVDIAAQTLPNLKTDIVAQSVGNIKTDIAAQSITDLDIDVVAQTISDLKILAPGGKAVSVAPSRTLTAHVWEASISPASRLTIASVTGAGTFECLGCYYYNVGLLDHRLTVNADGDLIFNLASPQVVDLLNGCHSNYGGTGATTKDVPYVQSPRGGIIWTGSTPSSCGYFLSFPIHFTSSFKVVVDNFNSTATMRISMIVVVGTFPTYTYDPNSPFEDEECGARIDLIIETPDEFKAHTTFWRGKYHVLDRGYFFDKREARERGISVDESYLREWLEEQINRDLELLERGELKKEVLHSKFAKVISKKRGVERWERG